MGIIYLLIILSGAILLDCFDDFQKVEHDIFKFNKLDRIFKNISNKYEERKYLGSLAAYMINANSTSYHLLLLLANDINPNPGPTCSPHVSYTRDDLLNFDSVNASLSQHLQDKINEIITPYVRKPTHRGSKGIKRRNRKKRIQPDSSTSITLNSISNSSNSHLHVALWNARLCAM